MKSIAIFAAAITLANAADECPLADNQIWSTDADVLEAIRVSAWSMGTAL